MSEQTKEQRDELRRKWIAALRSGEFKQCHGMLFKDGGFCCLGVGCKVVLGEVPDETHPPREFWNAVGLKGESASFDTSIKDCENLVDLNDIARLPFPEIADILEANMIDNRDGIFVEDNS